jgi:ribosome-binding protein aMBF1 (putative translation factor)
MPSIDTTPPRSGNLGDFVGVWIRDAREQRNWSQQDFALKIQRPQSMISRWERGRSVPDVAEWVQICAALGRNPCDSLGRVIQNESAHLPLFAGR